MLAIASLHIAKLQNGPVAASLKHYAIGLRRVGKLINLPDRQTQPATLAAAMLLAFYECWCADHQKWSNHILGARQLLRGIDFVGKSRHVKELNEQRWQQQMSYQRQQQEIGNIPYHYIPHQQKNPDQVDEDLLGILMGSAIPYDSRGRVMDENSPGILPQYSQKELDDFEIQKDLYWWYCKQDAYQGILGGGKLLQVYSPITKVTTNRV
jgi:hypothetical protein